MTIHKRMERHGISFDEAVAMQKRSYKRMTNEVVLQAVELRATGKTIKDAAKILGVDCGYIARKVREYQNGKTD